MSSGETLNFCGGFVSPARCGVLHAASQNRDPGFFEQQATGTPALQRTASRRATRCTASGERAPSKLAVKPSRKHRHRAAVGVVGGVGDELVVGGQGDLLVERVGVIGLE